MDELLGGLSVSTLIVGFVIGAVTVFLLGRWQNRQGGR
jgi:hypothetical protein